MLRRRILASAMASVMAIGSVAVVASAEETAAATTQVKTKADLEAYVKTFEKFRTDGINDYGSKSGDRFIAMCDFAENVIADAASTVDDYTAAYKMLEAVYNKLKIYTAEELKTLINENKKIYDTNNIMNEEYGDAIYKDDKSQWTNFSNAFENAQSVVGSADSRIISDAYEELADAKSKLKALDAVTKAQFRTAMKNLETALQLEYKYDAWRRGTIVDSTWSVQWAFDSSTYAWGSIFYAVQGKVANIDAQYEDFINRKSVNKTTNEDIVNACQGAVKYTTVLNSFVPDDATRGSKSSVKALLDQYHGLLVHDYATTAADALYAEAVSKGGIKDANGWSATVTSMSVATAAAGLLPNDVTAEKTISASLSVKPQNKIWIITNKDGYANIYDANGAYDATMVAAAIVKSDSKPSVAEGLKAVAVNKNSSVELSKYIKVDAADVIDSVSDVDNHLKNDIYDGDGEKDWATGGVKGGYEITTGKYWMNPSPSIVGSWILESWSAGAFTTTDNTSVTSYVTLDKAMQLAEFYLNAGKDDWASSDIYDIDDTGAIAKDSAKGSSTEWTLVNRFLKYALEDKYKGSTGSHTKAEISKLIEDCYELVEKTGDAAMFSYNNANLTAVRQDALEWLKAANKDKKYKDNDSTYDFGSKHYDSTKVYDALNGAYNELKNDYDAFTVSFGDIYYRLAEVADLIDNGEIEATDAIKAAMEDVAYKLVVAESLDDEIGVAIDNDVFTTDYTINKVNRVYTKGGEYYQSLDIDSQNTGLTVPDSTDADNVAAYSHNELYKAYTTLDTEVKKQTDPEVKLGDVNGDGVVNALDASAILKAVVANTAIDVKVGDYNADGAVNALDASAILKAVVAGTI